MIGNWKKLLLTFVVGAFVYLFSVATAEYGQIRADITKEAAGYSKQDGNTVRFSALVRSLTGHLRGRVEPLRTLEHNAPIGRPQIDASIVALTTAANDCAADIAVLRGFPSGNDSITHTKELLLDVLEAENNLRLSIIHGLQRDTLRSSPDIAVLNDQLMSKARTLSSSLDEAEGQLKDVEDTATNSISEYDRRYNVLGIKILSALLFVIIGSTTLLANFLRERNRRLAKARLYQGFSG
jgi:hypothetical protein